MLPRGILSLLYHIGLVEYEGNFPSSHRLTPAFWQTLELRREARVRAAFRIKALETQVAQLLEIDQVKRRGYRSHARI
jgi:hypothetical protein